MTDNTVLLLAAITALAAVAVLLVLENRGVKQKRLTPLGGLAFACIVAGFVFHKQGILSYGLLFVGVILAVIDVLQRLKKAGQ